MSHCQAPSPSSPNKDCTGLAILPDEAGTSFTLILPELKAKAVKNIFYTDIILPFAK